nr:hypothetical protein [Neobacillus sp. Marseille-Q6967]
MDSQENDLRLELSRYKQLLQTIGIFYSKLDKETILEELLQYDRKSVPKFHM